MSDYKKMYFMLFNKITDTIEELQKIQQLCEEMYMNEEDGKDDKDDDDDK